MTATSHENVGRRSAKERSNPPRAPTPFQAAARSRELLGKGVSKAGSIGLTVVPLTLSGSAVVAASTVRSWPAVVAMAMVLVVSLVWVALGPTVSSCEVELSNGAVVRQHQLTFARRAPLHALKPTHVGSLDARAVPDSSASLSSLRTAEPIPSTAEVRAWAREHGLAVGQHGPLSAEVRRAFDEAHVAKPLLASPSVARRSTARGLAEI
jgi:hypothetical protein